MKYTELIRERIDNAKPGSVFVNSDFADLAYTGTIRKCLNRLVQAGVLIRIRNGLYEKPVLDSTTGDYKQVDTQACVNAIVRDKRWTIAPSGAGALFRLGLSDDNPEPWVFVTNGPNYTIEINGTEIVFLHRSARFLVGLSETSALVVQAFRYLGKSGVTDSIIEQLSVRLSIEEKKALLAETKDSSDWIYVIVRRICMELLG